MNSGVTPHQDSEQSSERVTHADGSTPRRPVHGLKRIVFLCGSGIFFVLGVLGALLPGLPATPFLLLTSYFLVRSSPRLNERLLRSKLFGPILTDWQQHGGVRPDVKLQAVIVVVIAVSVTLFFTRRSLVPGLIVVVLATIGIIVILRLPVARIPESDDHEQ